jgi:hypothetical protein
MTPNINNLYTRPARNNAGALLAGQQLTVDATAGGVSITTPYTQSYVQTVEWDVQDADVYVTFDGTTPSATNGHWLRVGQSGTWSVARTSAAKFIRVTGTSGVIQFSPSSI